MFCLSVFLHFPNVSKILEAKKNIEGKGEHFIIFSSLLFFPIGNKKSLPPIKGLANKLIMFLPNALNFNRAEYEALRSLLNQG